MDELCVVLGASGAVGGAICRRLAPRYRVLAIARNPVPLAELAESLPGVRTLAADATDDAFVDTVAAAVAAAGQPVRLAVSAAGLSGGGSLDEISPTALGEAVNTKAGGTMRLFRAVAQGFGRPATFVAVAGSLGFEPGPRDALPGTANAALANLMRQLSQLHGPQGISVHTIAPGPLDTPRLDRIVRQRAETTGLDPGEVRAEFTAQVSSGRLPTAEDVAWLVETLLSPHAAALHGSVLSPDGGTRRGLA